ncbi:Aspartokinase [Marasmius crinis-equi]|uniref:aspartate kinase n=1 Tax=Marasmius crinis-equi TaxID=585013 RepID=A0ABR3EPI4_9AGAR
MLKTRYNDLESHKPTAGFDCWAGREDGVQVHDGGSERLEYVLLEDIVSEADEDGTSMLTQEFYDRVAVAVGEQVQQCAPRVPVVTALLAIGLEAAELQIWKEVDGILTADPRKAPTACVLLIITPDEAAELTYYGSEVVHPFTMEQVIRRKIPIRMKHVENSPGQGTVIFPDPDPEPSVILEPSHDVLPNVLDTSIHTLQAQHDLMSTNRRLPTAVTIKENILVININSNRKSVSHGFFAGIFGTLDRFGVVVDLISTSEVQVSMAIEDTGKDKVVERLIRELKKVTVHRNMIILSLVGKHMRHLVGVAGKMFTTLGNGNVNIEMISQGASEINISCVIGGKDAVKALNLIHQTCLQIPATGRSEWVRNDW